MSLTNTLNSKLKALLATLATLTGYARQEWGEPAAEALPGSGGPVHRAAQAGTVISVVVIGVIALIGILIFAQVSDALPDIQNTQLNNSASNVTTGFANAMELIPIVLLVLVASLVISVVQRMRAQ